MFQKALKFREEHTYKADTYDEFKAIIEKGGFVYAPWDGTEETKLKANSLFSPPNYLIDFANCVNLQKSIRKPNESGK